MSSSHSLLASVARERHAERYRAGSGARVARTSHVATVSGAAQKSPALSTDGPVAATRRRAGWLLVGLGLRLITGDNRVATQRARLIGQ